MNKASHPDFDRCARTYEDDLQASIPSAFAEDGYFAEYKICHVSARMVNQEVKKFLDFGCGIGQSLAFIMKKFPRAEVWGHDVSPECISLARQRYRTAILTTEMEELPPASFDVVFIANVFHHVPVASRLSVLGRCKGLLRHDGRIFMFEHNPLNPVTRMIFERCRFDKGAKMLRKREALALASGAGLRVLRCHYTLFFPRQLKLIRSLEPMLAWLPLGAQYCVEMAL